MKKIKVLVVEDSPVVRELLVHIINSDPRLTVVGAVGSAEEALSQLDTLVPDVISLDIRLPGMNGLDATLEVMASRPTPIVVVSASVEDDDLNIAMNALRAGALTVVEKPVGISNEAYQEVATQLCNQLAIMSQVKVVRQARRRGLHFGSPGRAEALAKEIESGTWEGAAPKVLALVASTGGPNALSQVLSGLGESFPLPILLVQHMTPSFLEGFVNWLNSITPFEVNLARDGMDLQPGRIYLPPPDHHLEVRTGHIRLSTSPPVENQRPSGTVLLRSVAEAYRDAAIGVILTGMGADGARGMAEMRKVGAYTIAEDETTTVIYGMPAEAVKIGSVRESLPLDGIAPRILELIGKAP